MDNLFSPTLTPAEAAEVRARFGTPAYVYSEAVLRRRAAEALAFPAPFGLKVRFAVKACSNAAILRIFHSMGLGFDASSGFEVRRVIAAGIPASDISLSTQELPADFADLVRQGIRFNACSLRQLEAYGSAFPGTSLGVRINPGMGSGHSQRTNVGGPSSSFGIWHEYLPRVLEIASRYGLKIDVLHSHIGSGADPEVWARVAKMNLETARSLPDVRILDMGGGFKVARMPSEYQTDFAKIGPAVARSLEEFAASTGRRLVLEIEPGTFLAAQSGAVVASVQDVADTGANGYCFLKLDTGMTEVLRRIW